MVINKRAIGAKYEQKAADYLEELGYTIITHNYRCKMGEIDLIAEKNSYLIFIEVKYRLDFRKGSPLEAINYKKQRTICKVADYYRMVNGIMEDIPCRFDVIGFKRDEVCLIENAFNYIE